jgi:NitT/TauT family transport system ATP-binding protein
VGSVIVKNLFKEFVTPDRQVVALNDVSFEAEGHTFLSVVGPSGCGKSTLLNILAGIDSPSSGEAQVLAEDGPARIGYVFQSPRLLPWATVLDNLTFVQDSDDGSAAARCAEFLKLVGLDDVDNSYPGELSGGMQQRVGIARAFSIDPDVLLMDEPFSHLDAITGDELRKELHKMWMVTKKTVVFVTHDISEAVELSNRVIVLAKGGTLADVVDIPLPFPRDPADDEVALATADLFRRFRDVKARSTA